MAKEALQKITEAESMGKAIKLEAVQNAKKTALLASEDGEKLIAQKISDAKKEAEKILNDTQTKCSAILDEAKEKAILEGEALKKLVSKNEDAVIDGIIELLA